MLLLGMPTLAFAEADARVGDTEAEPLTEQADEILVASGTWGTCPWTIDTDGLLKVYPGTGSDVPYMDGVSVRAASPWHEYESKIKSVKFVSEGDARVVLPRYSGCLFSSMYHLTSADLSEADASSAKDMWNMFWDCNKLVSADVSGLVTSSVTDISDLFHDCESLVSVNTAGWDTSSVVHMFDVFDRCESLTSLDVSSWDTSSVTSFSYMFWRCSQLTTLDLSGWDTSSLEETDSMFQYCSSLETLDLSGWNTPNLKYTLSMFDQCSSLKTVYVGDGWNTSKVTVSRGMFNGCSALKGSNGTAYDPEHTDAEYARVDMGGKPGYFTYTYIPDVPDEPDDSDVPEVQDFKTANLTLGEQVGLTFWAELPEGADQESAYVDFSVGGKSARTAQVTFGDSKASGSRRGFTFDLTSIEMAEPVTATLHYELDGVEKTSTLTYTIEQYFRDFDKVASRYPEEAVELVHATANYGHYMQPFLSAANGWSLGDDYQELALSYGSPDVSAASKGLSSFAVNVVYPSSLIRSITATVSFGSLTSVDYCLTPVSPDSLFAASTSWDWRKVSFDRLSDGRQLIRFDGIMPQDFGRTLEVSGSCDGKYYRIDASVLGIMGLTFNSSDATTQAAYASAYELWKAAQAFAD